MLNNRMRPTALFTLSSLVLDPTAACGAQSDENIVKDDHRGHAYGET